MAEATRIGSFHKSTKSIDILKMMAQLNTIHVAPVDPTAAQENAICAIIDAATKSIAYCNFLGREEKISEFQLTSTWDYWTIKELRNSDGIIMLKNVLLKITLYEDDECVFTLRFIPPRLTEEELR